MKKKAGLLVLFISSCMIYAQGYKSWDYYDGIAANNKLRVLNIFVNVIYDLDTTINKVEDTDPPHWPRITNASQAGINVSGTIPNYLLDFMDTSYVCGNTQGTITRLYGESSFDSLQLIGDFVVVNLLESRVIQDYAVFNYGNIAKTCINMINDTPTGLHTIYGHDSICDYSQNSTAIDFFQIIIRNISKEYGGLGMNSGCKTALLQGKLVKFGDLYYPIRKYGTIQNVGSDDVSLNPTGIVSHEISHALFGGNNFHTSGGNHRGSTESMPWMNIQGGYGLMGAAHSGLVSCNGYERWRMHWKHAGSPYYISAHNISNNMYVNSDIKKEDGTKWFLLRDFVTYGDAVRIKMPYKDSTITPNQYIWLEFHNVGHNNKLDFLQYSNSDSCLYSGTPGIYAYYQIGRDVLESENRYDIWDIVNRDNLRIISNEGYWDYTRHIMERDTSFDCTQWNWVPDYYTPDYSNAFCGYNDQEKFIVPEDYDTDLGSIFDDPDDIQERVMSNKIAQGDTVKHSLSFLGDSLDAFSSHRKINMGTNPSTCNAKTYYSYNTSTSFPMRLAFNKNSQYNNATTYLTGLSIEMIPRPDSVTYLVKIRWDDYDIVDDARWTGKIALKGTERVNLTRGHDITLAQNRTPAQQIRDSVSGYFAAPTQLTCEAGSVFAQEPQSTLTLTEKSRFVLDSGAVYQLGDSAQILVQGGSTFTIGKGADLTGGIASEIVVDSLSTLCVYDTAKLRREARLIVRPGGKLIVDGGTLTNACEGEMWQGIIVEGNPSLPQYAQRQGSVILNNATVENARNAISTHTADSAIWIGTGGIVQATNTLFRNNLCSMEMSLYENRNVAGDTIDNTSHFNNCTFRIDTANLFPANNCTFVQHVSLWGVRGVKFNGCTFQNQDTTHSYVNRGRALYTADAGYRCRRICPVISDTDPCACQPSGSQPVVRCSFTGFYKAIESTGDCGQGSIVIDNCDFANNFVGIVLNASDNAQVSYNHFNLDFSQKGNSGLRLASSTGFTVEDNDFVRMLTTQDTIYGIICDNTGNAENFIRRNDFSNLFYGCYSLKNNGPIANRPRGLQFNCNSYTANTYDIYVPANSTIRNVQGSLTAGADNDFSNTITRSLTIPMTMNTLSYYYSSGNSHIPVGTSNYTGYGTATANPCASTLCGLQNPGFPPGIIRYASLSEEYEQLSDEFERRGYGAILSDRGHYTDSEVQDAMAAESRLDSLSVEMAELSNRGIKAVIQDSVMDFSQLKDWFGLVNTLSAKYLLVETHYLTGDYAAANRLLSALPDMFDMSEEEQEEYGNYRAFHALRNALAGNTLQSSGVSARRTWAELTEPELAELQRIAEGTQGRTATMAQGILCFFYRICYEEDNVFGDAGTEFFTPRSLWESQPATESSALHVYPNPAGSVLHIESGSSLREVTAYDPTGRIVLRQSISGTSQTLDISQLHSGIYLLRVVTENGVETGRFVKN